MSKTRPVVTFVFALLLVSVGSGAPLAFADVYWVVKVRENNQNFNIWVSLTPDQCTYYTVAGNYCSNNAHRTKHNNNTFDHFHVAYSIPKSGYRDGDPEDPADLTATKIDARWDWYYDDQEWEWSRTSLGNQQNFNCWSYALGYESCWIQHPQPIGNDDWDREYVQDAELAMNENHARMVVDVDYQWGIPFVSESDEKFSESKKYEVFFTYGNPEDIQVYWVPKP